MQCGCYTGYFVFDCPHKNPRKTILFCFNISLDYGRSLELPGSRSSLSVTAGLVRQEAPGVWLLPPLPLFFLAQATARSARVPYVTDNTPAPPPDVDQLCLLLPERLSSSRYRKTAGGTISTL